MLKTCRKDYLAVRWFWLGSAVLYLLYVIQPLASSLLLMAFGMMLVLADLMIPLFIEDKDKTEILFASLPTSRKDIVRGRHLMAGFLLAGGVLLIFGSAAGIKKIFSAPSYQKSLSPLLTVEGVAGFLIAAGLLTASYLPLYHRLGLGRGNMVFFMGGLALLGAAAGLERLASKTLNLIPPLFTADFLKDPGQGLIGRIGAARTEMGTPLFVAATAALLAALFWISARLSTRFYRRREF